MEALEKEMVIINAQKALENAEELKKQEAAQKEAMARSDELVFDFSFG